jgi:hypothetical protein
LGGARGRNRLRGPTRSTATPRGWARVRAPPPVSAHRGPAASRRSGTHKSCPRGVPVGRLAACSWGRDSGVKVPAPWVGSVRDRDSLRQQLGQAELTVCAHHCVPAPTLGSRVGGDKPSRESANPSVHQTTISPHAGSRSTSPEKWVTFGSSASAASNSFNSSCQPPWAGAQRVFLSALLTNVWQWQRCVRYAVKGFSGRIVGL